MKNSYSIFLSNLFSTITYQRSALMGLATIAVFLSHAPSLRLGYIPTGIIGLICQYGSWGVDVFIFLSALGLSNSLTKNKLSIFYKNRFIRIIPTWLLVLVFVHLAGLIISNRIPYADFSYPKNLIDYLCWYSGIGFFLNTCYYEWYVPALLFLYLIAPLMFKQSKRMIYFLIVCSLAINILNNYYEIFPHLNIMIERLPIFCIGFLFFKEYNDNNMTKFIIAEFIFILFVYLLWKANLCSITILFGGFIPIILALISLLLKYTHYTAIFLSFLGSISLEFYLIHLYRRPQFLLSFWIDNPNLQVILAFFVSFGAAVLLHKVMKILHNINQKR